jgi:hypothetical protein
MFKFDNNHIFTGYLKQKLSAVNIPTCKIYTQEFEDFRAKHGYEDPRVVESINTTIYGEYDKQLATYINYLKNNVIYNYFEESEYSSSAEQSRKGHWTQVNNLFYDSEKYVPGFTRRLKSPGSFYDKATHEYLGDYLRFLRDYHNINLMSLYNCFNNTLCNNLDITFEHKNKKVAFNAYDHKYCIYAIPVKLFNNYTIAVDSPNGIEIVCGFYNTHSYTHALDQAETVIGDTSKSKTLYTKTYKKINKTFFSQPILFNNLNVDNWPASDELENVNGTIKLNNKVISRRDILKREQDLKMFIKIPATCKSSIVILEGDFRNYNNVKYTLNINNNLVMEGCSVGSKVTIKNNNETLPHTSLAGYRLDKWYKYYHSYNDNYEESLTNEDTIVNGLVVPTIELIENSENLTTNPDDLEKANKVELWRGKIHMQKPEKLEDEDVCLISNGAELAYVVYQGGKTTFVDLDGNETIVRRYKVTKDIYLNDPSRFDWETGISSGEIQEWFHQEDKETAEAFSGTIDGDGHVIYGLYFKNNSSTVANTGLIPLIDANSKTVIKNLGINYAYLEATNASAFAGKAVTPVGSLDKWVYKQNHSIINLENSIIDLNTLTKNLEKSKEAINNNNTTTYFKPISRLQLLEFNTGESYPFADRLVEYLSGSAITPIDEIPDNIKRAQRVMQQNQHYFKIEGLWENKMQKIIYDYIANSGPIMLQDEKLVDFRQGYHTGLGHTRKSTLFDVLGFIDKDAEKWYASWSVKNNKEAIHNTIQNVDIYVDENGKSLYEDF